MKDGFTPEEWVNAERVDFSLTEEQIARLDKAINALKALGHEFDIPVHAQACVGYADKSYTLMGASVFTNPARIPMQMLASHQLAVGSTDLAVELIMNSAY